MKSQEILKDIFSLAVRLVGLYFIYRALAGLDVPAFTDVTLIKSDNLDDVITTLLPVLYNLAVGWWLLGSSVLNRRAYPERSKISDRLVASATPTVAMSESSPSPALTDSEIMENKLAALVAKPPDSQPAK